MAIADVLAEQVRQLPCQCVQVDEANIPGNPIDGPLAARRSIACSMPSMENGRFTCALAITAGRPFRRGTGRR